MKFDKAIVWGFVPTTDYWTHSHIHYGFYKALKFLGYDAEWRDKFSTPNWDSLPSTLFVTNQDQAHLLPLRHDHAYVIHGGACNASWQRFEGYKRLSWNVFIDPHRDLHKNPDVLWLDEDIPFMRAAAHMDFRWATDLTPPEIEANKHRAKAWNGGSSVIHYVGSRWFVNEKEFDAFRNACGEGGVQFVHHGAGQEDDNFSWMGKSRVVSPEDNERLVRESLFGPAIVGGHHHTEGYLPCRILKNISYGCMGVTNSAAVNRIFADKLVFHPDAYSLFFHAREVLPTVPVENVHELMDVVKEKFTYVNRLGSVFKALEMLEEG